MDDIRTHFGRSQQAVTSLVLLALLIGTSVGIDLLARNGGLEMLAYGPK